MCARETEGWGTWCIAVYAERLRSLLLACTRAAGDSLHLVPEMLRPAFRHVQAASRAVAAVRGQTLGANAWLARHASGPSEKNPKPVDSPALHGNSKVDGGFKTFPGVGLMACSRNRAHVF